MTKPAKEGQEGFDPKQLLHDAAAEEGGEAEGDEAGADEGDEQGSDEISLDELDKQLRKSIEEALNEGGDGEEEAEDDDDGEEPAEDDIAGQLKKVNAELRRLKQERKKKEIVEARTAAAREVAATVREFKLTKAELNQVVRYFLRNPDMEGVVPFRQAAIRVLGLGDRASSSDSGGRNGDSRRSEGAHVITRGGGAPPARRQPFKPSPERGNYSGVTAAILSSGSARKLIATD